jgi:hypothetical protein
MKLGPLEDDSAYISNTEEEALISFRELTMLTSVDSDLPHSPPLFEYGNPKNRGYSLCQRYLRMLNPFILGSIGNEDRPSLKDIGKAFASIKRPLLQVKVAQAIRAYSDEVFLPGIQR